MAEVEGLVYSIEVDPDTGIASLKKFDRATAKSESKTKKHAKGIERSWDEVGDAIVDMTRKAELAFAGIAIAAGVGAVIGIKKLGSAALNTAADFQRMRTALETVTGSAQAARDVFEEVTVFAANTPFQIPELVEATTLLRGIGIAGIETIETLGNTAAAFGRSIGDVTRAFINPQREVLISYGIELARQGDVWEFQFADAWGNTQKIVSEGSIEVQRKVLAAIWNDRYAGGMDRLSNTYLGMLSNLEDEWTLFLNEIGEGGLLEAFETLVSGGLDLIGEMKDTGELQRVAENLASLLVLTTTTMVGLLAKGVGWIDDLAAAAEKAVNIVSDLNDWFDQALQGEGAAGRSTVARDSFMSLFDVIREGQPDVAAWAEAMKDGSNTVDNFRASSDQAIATMRQQGDVNRGLTFEYERAVEILASAWEAQNDLNEANEMAASITADATAADEARAQRMETLTKVTDDWEKLLSKLNETIAENIALGDQVGVFGAAEPGADITSNPSVFNLGDASPTTLLDVAEPSLTGRDEDEFPGSFASASSIDPLQDPANAPPQRPEGADRPAFDLPDPTAELLEPILGEEESPIDAAKDRMTEWLEFMTDWTGSYDSLLLESAGVSEIWSSAIVSSFDSLGSVTSSMGKILGANNKFVKGMQKIQAASLLVEGVISTYKGAILVAKSIYPPNPPGLAGGFAQIAEGVAGIAKAKQLGAGGGGSGRSAPGGGSGLSPPRLRDQVAQNDPNLFGGSALPSNAILVPVEQPQPTGPVAADADSFTAQDSATAAALQALTPPPLALPQVDESSPFAAQPIEPSAPTSFTLPEQSQPVFVLPPAAEPPELPPDAASGFSEFLLPSEVVVQAPDTDAIVTAILAAQSAIPTATIVEAQAPEAGVVVQDGGIYVESAQAMDAGTFRDFVTTPENRESLAEAQVLLEE